MISHENKPVLIINCSKKKLKITTTALQLYMGGIFQMLKANLDDPLMYFEEILILSAKHGLIRASDTISDYEHQMVSRKKHKN